MKAPVQSPAQMLTSGRALTFANVAEGAEGLVISDLARAVAARPKPPAISMAVVCRDGARMQPLARAPDCAAAAFTADLQREAADRADNGQCHRAAGAGAGNQRVAGAVGRARP